MFASASSTLSCPGMRPATGWIANAGRPPPSPPPPAQEGDIKETVERETVNGHTDYSLGCIRAMDDFQGVSGVPVDCVPLCRFSGWPLLPGGGGMQGMDDFNFGQKRNKMHNGDKTLRLCKKNPRGTENLACATNT